MRTDRAPYWYPGLDGWNAAIAVILTAVVVVTAATGGATIPSVASTPTISQPASGSSLSAAAPGAVVGQAPPGSVVQVYDGDKLLGETKADQAGNYRFSLPTLAQGPHTLSTRVTDATGNLIASSAPIPVIVSGGPLALVSPTPAGAKPGAQALAFTGLPQGTQWPSGLPVMLAGTAPPGSKVQVFDNDRLVTETVARPDGKWSLPLPALPTGDHFLMTRAFGPDGALLGESAPVKVTVVGPGTPTVAVQPAATAGVQVTQTAVVTSAPGTAPKATVTATLASTATLTGPAATAQAARPVFTGLTEGAQLSPGAPLTGTAAPGTKIRLFDGDKQIGETTAGPDGKWSLALPALATGAHALTARALGPDGSVLGASLPMNVTVGGMPGTAVPVAGTPAGTAAITGTVRPTGVAPATQIAQAAGATPGTPQAARTTGATTGTPGAAKPAPGTTAAQTPSGAGVSLPAGEPIFLMGSAAPGAALQLYVDDALAGETIADATGQWRLILPALRAGAHELIARIYDAAGKQVSSSAPLTVTVTEGGTPGAVQPAAAATAVPGAVRPVGTTAAPPLSGPAATAQAAQPAFTGLSKGALLAPGALLTGSAIPGTKIQLFDGDQPIAETTTGADGKWSLAVPSLAAGAHALMARALGPDGSILGSSAPLLVRVSGTPAPVAARTPSAPGTAAAPPAITGPLPGAEVSATSPGTLEGRAEPGSTIRIYDGDTLVAEIVVGPDGTWRVMLPQMAEGPHTFVVRVVSPDGSEAIPSPPVLVIVRPALITTPVPEAPGAAPSAARPSVSSPVPGGAIQSSQPLLSGSAAPGSTVRIYDGDVLIDETTADSAGRWHFVPPIPLAIGKHALRVASVGPDGVEAPSEVLEIVVAEGATGLKPLMFSASYGKAPSPFGLLQGTAPPGAIVVLYDGDVRVAKIPVGADGQWQYVLPARTRLGQHQYSIVVTSSDGTTIYRSQPVAVRIGAAPPKFLPRTGPDD